MKENLGSSLELNQDAFILREPGGAVWECGVAGLFAYSLSKPWDYTRNHWEAFSLDTDRNEYTFRDNLVAATLRLEQELCYVKLTVGIENISDEAIRDFSCALSFPVIAGGIKATVPHVIYNDNPSAAPERIVPHIGREKGRGIIVEEHRLPVPAVNLEWASGESPLFLSVLSLPDVKTGEDSEYWSLGVLRTGEGLSATMMSGPLMFNGEKDMVYGGQCFPMPYKHGYRVLGPSQRLTKTYYLHFGRPQGEGKGFRSIIKMGREILKPETEQLHGLRDMIRLKTNVMDSRFHENNRSTGYICYGSANKFGDISGRPEYYLYAWTGQALKLAWCDCALGLETEESFRWKRGFDVADFFVRNSACQTQGLRRTYYYLGHDKWGITGEDNSETISSRMQGESLMDLLDIMQLIRHAEQPVPAHWEKFVRDSCSFMMDESYQTADKIYPLAWTPDGGIPNPMINAAGMPCVVALIKAYQYFGDIQYLDYAQKKYAVYCDLHIRTFDIPFARATMDARCEDKEAGLYFFVAAAELFKTTKRQEYAETADICADWMLTFVYFWETGFNPHTICARKGFKTTGWPGVSVQNHHLDVFFPTYELYEYGRVADKSFYREMALHVRNALTHGVSTYPGEWGFSVVGEQGEQYYQTNYGQSRKISDAERHYSCRGGMHVWNPSWITAQVLQSSIRFQYNL